MRSLKGGREASSASSCLLLICSCGARVNPRVSLRLDRLAATFFVARKRSHRGPSRLLTDLSPSLIDKAWQGQIWRVGLETSSEGLLIVPSSS